MENHEIELSEKSKNKVLVIYPDAKVERDGAMYFVSSGKGLSRNDLGAGFSKNGAWCSAWCQLNK